MEYLTETTALLVAGGLCISMFKCGLGAKTNGCDAAVGTERGLVIAVLSINAALLIWWFQLKHAYLTLIVSSFMSYFYPYVSKTSRHRQDYIGPQYRQSVDKLITTSAIYLVGAVVGVYYAQYDMALICFVTFAGSSLYHLHREMVFFNLDNIFATSLLVVFVYMLCSAYFHHEIVFILGAWGMPVAVFLIAYCGMPAEITLEHVPPSDRLCCTRTGREMYDSVHTMWHLASGGGPILAVWYFDYLKQNGLVGSMTVYNPITLQVESVSSLAVLPYVALGIALCMNLMGNYYDIMPLE